MASMNVRSGDLVEVIVGGVEARGKRGKVIVANPEKGTVIVEGLNLVTKHKKPRSAQEQGGKIEMPRAINVSNVMSFDVETKTICSPFVSCGIATALHSKSLFG